MIFYCTNPKGKYPFLSSSIVTNGCIKSDVCVRPLSSIRVINFAKIVQNVLNLLCGGQFNSKHFNRANLVINL